MDSDGSRKFSDIVAFPKNDTQAFIIDPTVRFESNDPNQSFQVATEKHTLYSKCEDCYNSKFSKQYGHRHFLVYGLLFGPRGTPSEAAVSFFKTFQLEDNELVAICENILIASIHIIHHHIYGN